MCTFLVLSGGYIKERLAGDVEGMGEQEMAYTQVISGDRGGHKPGPFRLTHAQ
jgi:hypothetical protein